MILNVGVRTDIVSFYGDWLMERFREGYVLTRNTLFPNKVTRYELSPEQIDAVVFCSKNYAPMLGRLRTITDRYRTYFQYTVTAYGKEVEPGIPDMAERIHTLRELSRLVGREKLAWRYDPVLLTPVYTEERHIQTFSFLCEALAPYVSRCIFSFVEAHSVLPGNMPDLLPIGKAQKNALAKRFSEIAAARGIPLSTCTTRDAFPQYGIESTGCVTLPVLGRANTCAFRSIPDKGVRHGCMCVVSRDVGWYNTCPAFCRYCYANTSDSAVRENIRLHDVHSPLLIGHLHEDDTVIQGNQTTFLKNDGRQISLFE